MSDTATRPGWFKPVAAVLLGLLAVSTAVRLEQMRQVEGQARHSLYLPSGKYLRHASLGFRTLLADMLYLWSIQYHSSPRVERWLHLHRLFDVITDLDPRYLEAYELGALILAWEAQNKEKGMELLDKGVRSNPDSWWIAFEAAYYAYKEMGDQKRSLEYIRIARERPEAPPYLDRWYHHTQALVGEGPLEDNLDFWFELLQGAEVDFERYTTTEPDQGKRREAARRRDAARRHIYELSIRMHLRDLQSALERFHQSFGRWPFALDELVQAELLAQLPTTPDGKDYIYDRQEVEISSPVELLFKP